MWQSGISFVAQDGPDGSRGSIQGQRYAADGSTLSGEFTVNSYTTSTQGRPAVAVAPGGVVAVVWESSGSQGTDSDLSSVQGQRFLLEADLEIVKDDGVTSAAPGDTLVYTIAASNNGPDAATSVTVTDTFPAGLTCSWTSVALFGASGNSTSSGDLADVLIMPAGSFVIYTVDCATGPSLNSLVANTATISSPVFDPVPDNNSATDVTLVPVDIFADGFESGNVDAWATASPVRSPP